MGIRRIWTRGIRALASRTSGNHADAPSAVGLSELVSNFESRDTMKRNAYEGKTLDDLPGPLRLPLIGSLWLFMGRTSEFHTLQANITMGGPLGWIVYDRGDNGADRTYVYRLSLPTASSGNKRRASVQTELVQKYGKLIKLDLGPRKVMAVACPRIMEEIYRSQEPSPIRVGPLPWTEYLQHNDLPLGLLTAQEDEWVKLRNNVRPPLLKSNSFETATPFLSDIISEFSQHLSSIADENGYVVDLPQQLQHLSHELIVMALFGKRLGCFSTFGDQTEAEKFISSVNEIIGGTLGALAIAAPLLRRWNTKAWRNHELAWDRLHKAVIELTKEAVDRQSELEGLGFVPLVFPLLAREGLSDLERVSVMIELLLGGVDTTSNTIGFALSLLAQHPDKQERLREDVSRMLSETGSDVLTYDQVQQTSYVRNTMRESLRKYPILSINGRMITKPFTSDSCGLKFREKDNIVFFHYHICNDSAIFDRADEFLPERFDRDSTTLDSPERQFVSIPFGFGTRGCIGKRLAEMEVCITLSKLVTDHNIVPVEGMEFKPIMRGVLTPGLQIPVRFQARSPNTR